MVMKYKASLETEVKGKVFTFVVDMGETMGDIYQALTQIRADVAMKMQDAQQRIAEKESREKAAKEKEEENAEEGAKAESWESEGREESAVGEG